ncbi:MAG: Na/Pi cotransporter family protein [Eubacteriales bacterium]|nr:Na/Pi cotransporter family protein [Eubacteriales bacterium]
MDLFGILAMVGGLALFLYGMQVMGDGLKKTSGGRLETILETLTSNRWKGALLGCAVTAVIQSSSATTVMVVGLVNSGIMKLSQAVGVILGANVGTTVTSWLLSLTGIESENWVIQLFKPSSFSPVIGIIGIGMLMMAKSEKKRDIGTIMVGFAVLMYGMEAMSAAVEPLAGNEKFTSILTMFSHPILGMLAGLVLTAIIQSSSASIGILQAISMSGTLTIGTAIPILMGENIGTAVTAILSSIGASKNARRAALMHLYFCIIKTTFFMVLFYAVNAIVHFPFMTQIATPFIIAIIHSVFNVAAVMIMLPVSDVLVKLALRTLPVTPDETEGTDEEKPLQILDPRFLSSPSFALEQCKTAAGDMAQYAKESLYIAMDLVLDYVPEKAKRVDKLERLVDMYEDQLGSYLVKLSGRTLSNKDSHTLSTLLHCISDFERISDHALNIMQSAEELANKPQQFSAKAREELVVFSAAVKNIMNTAVLVFQNDDLELAQTVEPLEEVIDGLNMEIKRRHIRRLRKGKCTIELGFTFSDITTSYERVADHCSNIAVCLLQVNEDGFDTHEYLERVRDIDNPAFQAQVARFEKKYALPKMKKEDVEALPTVADLGDKVMQPVKLSVLEQESRKKKAGKKEAKDKKKK